MKTALLFLAMTVSALATKPAEIETRTDVITDAGKVEFWTWETRGKRVKVTIRDAKVLRVFHFTTELP